MRYFYIEPEVAGGLGQGTVIDRSAHPPIVLKLNYELDGWLGDAILETFPVFIVTAEAMHGLTGGGVTGVDFDSVDVTTSEEFRELYPELELPPFVWLRPVGNVGEDDFAAASDGRLVVSERALDLLRRYGVENASVEPFDA